MLSLRTLCPWRSSSRAGPSTSRMGASMWRRRVAAGKRFAGGGLMDSPPAGGSKALGPILAAFAPPLGSGRLGPHQGLEVTVPQDRDARPEHALAVLLLEDALQAPLQEVAAGEHAHQRAALVHDGEAAHAGARHALRGLAGGVVGRRDVERGGAAVAQGLALDDGLERPLQRVAARDDAHEPALHVHHGVALVAAGAAAGDLLGVAEE